MTRIGIALGSNLDDRARQLAVARDAILAVAGPQTDYRQAPLFASSPVDCPPGSAEFLNTALEIDLTDGDVQGFLLHCQEIERTMGRPLPKHRFTNAPRTIDIDLLYLVNMSHTGPNLTLPHPRLTERRFVLEPLSWIAADRIPGGLTRTVAEYLGALPVTTDPLILVSTEW